MKKILIIFLLFNFSIGYANNLEVQVNFGFCSSQGSGQAIVIPSGGESPYTYQWSNPDLENEEVFDLEPGVYSVTVSDAAACSVVETFEILATSSVELELVVVDITCFGASDGKIFIDNFSPPDLQFSNDGINFSDQVVFENLGAGDFNLFIKESNGCITEQIINVGEPFELQIDLGPDVEIELGDSIQVEALVNSPSSLLSFNWTYSANGRINCSECFETYILPLEAGTLTLTVEDEFGCTASGEVFIGVRQNAKYYIPNAFTPNGDGFNDIFQVFVGPGIRQIKKMIIRDNFGSIVHETIDFLPNSPGFGWDGRFRGRQPILGVYLYQIQIEYIDGRIEDIFGTITAVH